MNRMHRGKTVDRWLDIDSTHRFRALYPNTNDFTVPINIDPSLINDPVLSSAPFTASMNPIGSNVTQTSTDAQHITLGVGEPDIVDFYVNNTLELMGQDHTIIAYNGTTQVATVDTPFSSIPPAGTSYIIRKVKSFFNSAVAIGPVDSRTDTVSSVNFINQSPSLTPGIFNTDFFQFANGDHGTNNSQIVVTYNPQPLNPAFQQPNHVGESQWVSTSPQGMIFTSSVTGTLQTLTVSLRCISSSSQPRTLQIQIATSNGNTILSSTTGVIAPSATVSDITFSLANINNPVQLNAGTAYMLALQDTTAGGNSTGWIEMFGVANPSNSRGVVANQFQVIPKYSLIVAAIGGNSQFVFQQTQNLANTQFVQAGGNQGFVFTTPGDTSTVFNASTGTALFVAFDAANSTRTIDTSLYTGNLVQSGTVSSPNPNQLVYSTVNSLTVTSHAYSFAPVSVTGNQQLTPNETSLSILTGTTGPGSIVPFTQHATVTPPSTIVAQPASTNTWHFSTSGFTPSTSPADFGTIASGIITPSNLENNATGAIITITGVVSGITFTPTVTFQAWWQNPGGPSAILNPMAVVATMGSPIDSGTARPYTVVFSYTQAECTNVSFSQSVDLIVHYTFDTGAGSTTYSSNSVDWQLMYPLNPTGSAIPILGGSEYTLIWNDQSSGGNDTGYTLFLGTNAQSAGLSSMCTTTVFPWINFLDGVNQNEYFQQLSTDPWSFQGLLPVGHEIGYWFQPSTTLPVLSITISLLCLQENGGTRSIQAQIRQGNASNLSGPIVEQIPSLITIPSQSQSAGTAPASITFTFSGTTVLNSTQTYTFSMIDSTADSNNTGGIYVYGILNDANAVGWDQGGLTQWAHPWVSAQMSVFSGTLVLETASQQTTHNLTGLSTLSTTSPLTIPFDIEFGDEGFVSDFGFLGSSFGARVVQVSLYGPTLSNLLFQQNFTLPDAGSSPFSTTSSSQNIIALGNQVPALEVVASTGTYFMTLLDVTPNNKSNTSGVYLYGLSPTSPQFSVIVPIFTINFGPPQSLSSFLGGFQDIVEFSPSVSDNLSILHAGGTVVSSTGKQLSSGWFYVTLDWIVIPKQIMAVGIGGLLTNYPLIYVVLVNQGSNTSQNLIHSNNRTIDPRATFPVEISSWLYSSDPTAFFTMKPHEADRRAQLMQLRLDQPISFQLLLPSGETISFETQDNPSPSPINPLVQVSASFRLTPV